MTIYLRQNLEVRYLLLKEVFAEIKRLERTVSGYFDYIEDLIERENTFTMQEFAKSVNEFLSFRRYDILPDKQHKGRFRKNKPKSRQKKNMTYLIRPNK